MLKYSDTLKLFFFFCSFKNRHIPKSFDFWYDVDMKAWVNDDPLKAINLYAYADDNLKSRFDKYNKIIAKKINKSEAIDTEFEPPHPPNITYFPFQKAGIEYLFKHKKVLLGDEPGTGKTIQVAGLINCMQQFSKILIISPNTVKRNWQKELQKWLTIPNKTISVSKGSEVTDADVIITNYELWNKVTNKKSKKYKQFTINGTEVILDMVKKFKKIDLLVLDESHNIKNLKSNTTSNIMKLKKYCDRIVLLSGTPILNRTEELWSTIKILDFTKEFGSTKDEFLQNYCGATYNYRTKRYESDFNNVPEHVKNILQIKLRTNFMIRRLKKDVLKELPEKLRSVVPIELDDSIFRKYNIEHIQSYISTLDSNNEDLNKSILSGFKSSDISEMAEIRKLIGMQKVRHIIPVIDELLESGESVIIFGHHKDVLNLFKIKYPNCSMITGDTPEKDRIKEVEKFQEGKTKVFIGNFQASGVGITLTKSSHVVMAELDWVPAMMLQAEDRALRIGQKNNVTVYYFIAENTLDGYIGNVLLQKMNMFERLLNTEKLT